MRSYKSYIFAKFLDTVIETFQSVVVLAIVLAMLSVAFYYGMGINPFNFVR